MNYRRIALAAIAATIVDGIYGFVVYGQVIGSEFARYPEIYRSSETQPAYLPGMFVGLLFAMFVAAYLYSKGYEGGNGMQEGMRFGVLIGLLLVGFAAGVDYAIMRIGRRMALYFGLASLVEWVVIGMVIGLVYKPAGPVAASRRSSGV